MQMRLIAGRDLQRPAIHLDEILPGEPVANGRHNSAAGHQEGPSVGMDIGAPPGRIEGQMRELRQGLASGIAAANTRPTQFIKSIIYRL